MIGRIISSVVGARVVFGIAVTALAGLGAMTWMWLGAEQEAATQAAAAQTARDAAEANAKQVKRIAAERAKLDRELQKLRQREQKRRSELRADLETMRDELANEDCANRKLPDAVARRVFNDEDSDADGDGKGDAAGKSDE